MDRVMWLAMLPGCLWIGPAEHASRTAAPVDTGSPLSTSMPTTVPALELGLEPPDAIDACGPASILTGTVASPWAGASLDATLSVGAFAVDVTLMPEASGAEATFSLPLPWPEPACEQPCTQPVTLAVTEPMAEASTEVLVDPASNPEVTTVTLAGLDVIAGGTVSPAPTDDLVVTLEGRRLAGADDVVLWACENGATPAVGCVDLQAVPTTSADGLTLVVPASALVDASCEAEPAASFTLQVGLDHPCGGSLTWVATDALTVQGDCDADGVPAPDDCDDRDGERTPGAVEQCDTIDRDCSGAPDDVVTSLEGGLEVARVSSDLQAALDAADAGSTVTLCGGTVTGTFDWPLGGISLEATNRATLDGGGMGPVIRYAPEQEPPPGRPEVRLQNLDIIGGSSTDDGAGLTTAHANLRLVDVTFAGHTTTGEGGGLSVEGSQVVLEGVVIRDNHAVGGGGLLAKGADVTGTGVEISGNLADDDGGGVLLRDASLTLDAASVIESNTATRGGGAALGLKQLSGTTALLGGVVQGNTATEGGGVAVVEAVGDDLQVTSEVTGNTANDGGGLYISEGTLTVPGGGLSGNTASGDSSAALVVDGAYLALECLGPDVDGLFGTSVGLAPPPPMAPCATLDGSTAMWTEDNCACP